MKELFGLLKKKVKNNKRIVINTIQYIGAVGVQMEWVYVVEFLKFSLLQSTIKIPKNYPICKPLFSVLNNLNQVILIRVRNDLLLET